MSISLAQINAASGGDTWRVAVTRLNQIINAVSTQVLTTAANSSGSITVGNAHVSGYFSSTLLATNTLRGGNVALAATLTIGSNVNIDSGNTLSVGNSTVNSFINSTSLVVNNATINSLNVASFVLSSVTLGNAALGYVTSTTTGTNAQIIDTFSITAFRAVEYFISVKNNIANGYQSTKLLIINDGTDAQLTEYGTLTTNGALGVFDVSSNATSIILYYTPTVANATLNATRTIIGV